jgi:imidazolonepropionase-like amidohydrolase
MVSLAAQDPDVVAMVADGAMVFTLGATPKVAVSGGPTTRMGSAAVIRQAFAEASEYAETRTLSLADRPAVNLGLEAQSEVLAGDRNAIFIAHRADDILTVLRLAKEWNLSPILAGGAEAYLVRDQLASAGVPVLLGPVMIRSWGADSEANNASYEGAMLLADAGVQLGFMGGFEGYVPKVRVVLWEAAIAASWGLGAQRTLRALTLGNAEILGIAEQVGSLEVGKRGDVAVFDGDPFEYTSHVCGVVIGGQVVSEICR